MLTVLLLVVSGAAVWAAEAPKPMLAEDTAIVTERNYFTNLNLTAYSLTVGVMEMRADKQGPPCPQGEPGERIAIRYNNTTAFLGPEGQKPECKLHVRRIIFSEPPHSP